MTEELEQGTEAWLQARCGKVTASKIADLMAKTKSGPAASRANYMAQLICERLTGTVEPTYTNAAMQHGTDTEPEARKAYELYANVFVEQVGMIPHPKIAMSGASPDGLVDDDGLVEIKCPNTATHLETLLGAPIERKYILQMQWQMACTGRKWCDFASFDPRLPESMRLFVRRIQRDELLLVEVEKEVREFISELDSKVAELTEKYLKVAA